MGTKSVRSLSTLEVEIRWGDAVLVVEHLTPPRSFTIGSGDGAPCDFIVPDGAIDGASREIVRLDESGAPSYVVTEDGEDRALPLALDAEVTLRFGEISVRLAHGAAEVAVPRMSLNRRRATVFAITAALHVGVLACAARAPHRSDADEYGMTPDDEVYISQMLAKSEDSVEEEASEEAQASLDEGGTATRAKGEEGGVMGSMGNRYGTRGPADAPPTIARQEALQNASEFGLVGLLGSGAGGDPNAPTAPWGRDDSTGNDPLSARGNMWGASIGDGSGAGGVGLTQQGNGPPHATATPARPPSAPFAPVAPAMPAVRLDPNGRFATTYRPGAGHLAAFESALARGILPPAEREVVSDIGARYVPEMAAPQDTALTLAADLERAKLGPAGGPVHLRLVLRSTDAMPQSHAHLSVHLVLDISGSMQGESITHAREAASALVDKLGAQDDFSMVTFSTDAQVIVADGPIGNRRAEVKRVIDQVAADGGTNIGAGLELGYHEAMAKGIPDDAVRVVFLVSDGHPNSGITAADKLSKLALDAFQNGIQTSSFGLGADYDGALMSSIASDGAGGYYYLKSADQIAPALVTEIDKRLDPVATAVELRVRLKNDVGLLDVYGSRKLTQNEAQTVRAIEVAADGQAAKRDHIKADRQDDTEGGMRFFFPAFARGDAHAMLLALDLPAGVDERDVAGVELKYKDRVHGKNGATELRVKIAYANSDAESAATANPSVARSVVGFDAGETLIRAAGDIARGDRAGAAALLTEREAIVRQAAGTLHEPLFLRDADRLARLRSHTDGSDTMSDPLVLSMLLETAGRAHLR